MSPEETTALETPDPKIVAFAKELLDSLTNSQVLYTLSTNRGRVVGMHERADIASMGLSGVSKASVGETDVLPANVYDFEALESLKQGIALDQRESEVLSQQTDANLARIRELLGAR
jgi:hypothetical protein